MENTWEYLWDNDLWNKELKWKNDGILYKTQQKNPEVLFIIHGSKKLHCDWFQLDQSIFAISFTDNNQLLHLNEVNSNSWSPTHIQLMESSSDQIQSTCKSFCKKFIHIAGWMHAKNTDAPLQRQFCLTWNIHSTADEISATFIPVQQLMAWNLS